MDDTLNYVGDSIDSLTRQPCIGCGGRTDGMLGHFVPTAECRRCDLGIAQDQGARMIYPVCERCARRSGRDPSYVDRVERRIIARWHAARSRTRRPAPAVSTWLLSI